MMQKVRGKKSSFCKLLSMVTQAKCIAGESAIMATKQSTCGTFELSHKPLLATDMFVASLQKNAQMDFFPTQQLLSSLRHDTNEKQTVAHPKTASH